MKIDTKIAKSYLENFLKTLKLDNDYCVVVDQIKGKTFAIATLKEGNADKTISNFMTYQEANCYLFGISAVKNNSIKF